MGATGLSADPTEYRARLAEQTDAQIDTWAAELMRDVAIRRGVVRVVEDFRRADEARRAGIRTGVRFRRRSARDRRQGRAGAPDRPRGRPLGARSRHPVAGTRTGAERLIEYLVANFDELVYV